jgi:hypothetical protein
MIKHDPDQKDKEQIGGPEELGRDALLRLAHYAPRRLENAESPTKVQYLCGSSGLEPDSRLQVSASTPGSRGTTVTYELETRALPTKVLSKINEILKTAEHSGNDPHDVARQIYQATVDSGLHVWRTIEWPSVLGLGAASDRGLFKPLVPPLRAYLRDPHTIGRRFSATRRTDRQPVTVTTLIDVEKDLVHVDVAQGTPPRRRDEHYALPGTLHVASSSSPEDLKKNLRSIAFSSLSSFSEKGLKYFREHMAATAEEFFMRAATAEPQTLTYTRRFPWNSTLRVQVKPSRAVVTISSGAVDKASKRSGTATIHKWYISSNDSIQGGASAQETLRQVIGLFGTLDGSQPLTTVVRNMNLLAGRQGIVARASVESILGSSVADAVRGIEGIRVSKLREEYLIRADQVANTLRGLNTVQITPTTGPDIKQKPQVIQAMEVSVFSQPGCQPALQLVAWNGINNRIHARLSPKSVQEYGGLEKTLVDLSQELQKQASETYPWWGRTRWLGLLQRITMLDPDSSSLSQMGDARLPEVQDIHSNRMLDKVAAPLITLFSKLSIDDGVTDSYVHSTGEKQLQVVLGEWTQPYALLLDIHGSALTSISVVPRSAVQNGERVLAVNKAKQFYVHVPLDLRVPDVTAEKDHPLTQLVEYFAELVSSRHFQYFKGSRLEAHVRQLAKNFPPKA